MGNAMNGPARPRRLLGLRRRPGRLALALFRMPLHAYRHRAGWLFGHTFLAFTHTGRKTGQPHDAVAMVLHYDGAAREAVVCAAWGPETDWYRNLQAKAAIIVHHGPDNFVPEHRFLSDDEAFTVAVRFRCDHPHRLRLLSTLLGWGDLDDDDRAVRVHSQPSLHRVPAGRPSAVDGVMQDVRDEPASRTPPSGIIGRCSRRGQRSGRVGSSEHDGGVCAPGGQIRLGGRSTG